MPHFYSAPISNVSPSVAFCYGNKKNPIQVELDRVFLYDMIRNPNLKPTST